MFPANTNMKKVLVTSLIITVFVAVALQLSGGYLVTKEAPYGIVSFEFARNLSNAQKIVDSWGVQGKIYAGLNLGLDYLFLVAYSLLLASGSLLVVGRFKEKSKFRQITGYTIATGCILAGFLDGMENYALINILVGNGSDVWAQLALWCAIPKFVLVGFGIIYISVGSLYLMITRS